MIITDDVMTSLSDTDLSGGTTTAANLYAQALYRDLVRQALARKSKHNAARALRGRARIAKRKAKRKS
ncbi:hypothetical protein [Xanthomonas phage BUDD]|nr:hypothetical protein [Xanthomonas phage BUDD]